MSSFRDQLREWSAKVHTQNAAVFDGVVEEVRRSIVDGSELTGAPGQPVDTGTLKASWITDRPDANTATIATNVDYAPYIEDGGNSRGPFTLRSEVGGFHSVAQTAANFDRIVSAVASRVIAGSASPEPISAVTGYSGEDGG